MEKAMKYIAILSVVLSVSFCDDSSKSDSGEDILGLAYIYSAATDTVDICVKDSIMYVASLNGLQIIDATDLSNTGVIGSVPISSGIPVDVEVNDTAAYVCTGNNQLVVVDISNKSNPEIETTVNLTGTNSQDVEIDGNLLLVVTGGYLEIYDISSPLNPSPVDTISIDHTTRGLGLDIKNKMAYVCKFKGTLTGIDIDCIDYSDTDDISIISHINLGEYTLADDIEFYDAENSLAIVSENSSIQIINGQEPAFPMLLDYWEPNGTGGSDAHVCNDEYIIFAQSYNGIRIGTFGPNGAVNEVGRISSSVNQFANSIENVDIGEPVDVECENNRAYIASTRKIIILEFVE
ncbi:MAG: hypothetical protein CVV44_08490 [Spirochaetae bacterium HGW-Spirochaetae-1]|jgi:hypothetical protein|nr:MAG: hypothetical protein CVV44_08490 [Spirochaetae bacterium HGW-Spirochaetae-1]